MHRWWEVARTWVVLLLVAFALNMMWEFVQLPLYGGPDGGTAEDLPTWILYRAGTNDALLIGAAAAGGLVVHRWSRAAAWVVLIVVLAAIAVFIEVRAITTARWAYSDAMPTIGIVGVSPLVQLPLTGVVTVVLTRPWSAHRRTHQGRSR